MRIIESIKNKRLDKVRKFLKLGLAACFIAMTISCNSFSPLSQDNRHSNPDNFLVINKKAGFQSSFFGDFAFAENMKDFRKLNPNSKPIFKDIILYGKTVVKPFYEVYIVEGKVTTPEGFTVKEEQFNHKTISFVISKNAPQYDFEFLTEHFNDFFDE